MTEKTPAELEESGIRRLGLGAALGLAGALIGIVFPITFLFLTTYAPGGFFTFNSTLLDATGILILAGAILFLLSLFVYRRSFSALRKIDARFVTASVLCIIGAIGFLLVIVAAAFLIGSSSSVLTCLKGAPSHALSCVRSQTPLGAYTALIGFWLGWLGGVGIFLGIWYAGSHYHQGLFTAGAIFYGLLLVLLVGPFIYAVVPFPGIQYLIFDGPILALVAPLIVLAAAQRAQHAQPT
jgi:hypothetical protein